MLDFETEILRAADVRKQSVSNRLALRLIPHCRSFDQLTIYHAESALALARNWRRGRRLVLVARTSAPSRAQAEGLSHSNPEPRIKRRWQHSRS